VCTAWDEALGAKDFDAMMAMMALYAEESGAKFHEKRVQVVHLAGANGIRCGSAHLLQGVVGTDPLGLVREPVHLLADGIDGTAEDARAALRAPDFPPDVGLVWRPRCYLPASGLVADMG
jgi:hypothetical protein